MANDNNIQPTDGSNSPIVIYTSSDGKVNLEVQINANTVWLTQQQIAQLYGKAVSTINEHIKKILAEEELKEDDCVKKFGNSEFQQKAPFNYNLSMIISVGYRVRSKQGTLFRQWATKRLEEYLIKGFTIDSERLKGNGGGGSTSSPTEFTNQASQTLLVRHIWSHQPKAA